MSFFCELLIRSALVQTVKSVSLVSGIPKVREGSGTAGVKGGVLGLCMSGLCSNGK